MTELFTAEGQAKMLQLARDYNVVWLPLAGVLATLLLLRLRKGRSAAGQALTSDRRDGVLKRAVDGLILAFATNWQLTLLASTALVLSLASGWTTWDGMRNFTGEPTLSLMITFGIQGVMLIIAWLIGESFASGMNQRNTVERARSTGQWLAGMIVGWICAAALLTLIANAFGAFDERAASSTESVWSTFADRALYVAAGLLIIATLVLNKSSDIAQPYVQSSRILAKNAVLWVMFLLCAATSVFFSFDSLFTSIFPQSERQRAAYIRAVNQVAGVVADIGATTQRRQAEEADRLFQSEGWKGYERNLIELSKASQGAEKLIEDYFVQQMEQRRRAIAEQQERIATSQGGQAGLGAKKIGQMDELSRLKAERPALASELAEKKSELEARARGLDGKRVEAMAEERGAEGTLKVGRGPQYRERVTELARLNDAYKIQEERVRDAQKRLTVVDTRVAQIERELAIIDGDMGRLKGEAQTAESRIQASEQSTTGESSARVDPARVRAAFESARGEFRQNPTVERLAALSAQCTQLYSALSTTPATKERVRSIDCDPKPAAEMAGRVFALNSGLDAFARNCAGGDKLPEAGGTDALLSFGRHCLQDSGLPSKDTSAMAAKFSGIDLNRDDKAHRFVVTWNAFQDGNRLAYLALAIAIAIDSLVFMSGLFGANAVRSPLTDLEGRTNLTADQLEGAIDATLKTTPDPKATLSALLRAMHPVHDVEGFTSAIVLDPRDPHIDDMRSVLVAGSTIGAVRRSGDTDHQRQYLVSTGLARYFAVAQRKPWPVRQQEAQLKDLVNVIGVALLPNTQAAAEHVLSELVPVTHQPGFAAGVDLDGLKEARHRPLISSVIGAGSTVSGAILRQKDDGWYFVSSDVYKTLLMMRAGAIAAFHPGAIAIRQRPDAPALSRGPVLAQIAPPLREVPNASEAITPESALAQAIRSDLIELGGLHQWSAGDLKVARNLGDESEPATAIKRLAGRAPRLAKLVSDTIEDNRTALRAAAQHLRAYNGGDQIYFETLSSVEEELEHLLPVLMLSLDGPYHDILAHLISQLEPQDGEGALSSADRLILVRAKQQMQALREVSGQHPERLLRVARIIEQYDERSAHGLASHSALDRPSKRHLN